MRFLHWISCMSVSMVVAGCGGRSSGATAGAGSSSGVPDETAGSGHATASGTEIAGTGATSGAENNNSASAGYGTPQDCAAAGGTCVLGGASCAKQGPTNTCNCNPGCNPGGAVCCLALVDAADASSGSQGTTTSPASGSCDAGASPTAAACPSFASSCPCGCYDVANPLRYDRALGCLDPGSPTVNVCSPSLGADAFLSCWVRSDTGDAYLFADTPASTLMAPGSGWQPCTQSDGIPGDAINETPACNTMPSAFAGTWSCSVDAGDSLTFVAAPSGGGLTETFSFPVGSGSGVLTCTEQLAVSGSTATLIPDLTTCSVPQGVDLEGVPAYESQTVSGNTLTLTGADEGRPLQTVMCTRQP